MELETIRLPDIKLYPKPQSSKQYGTGTKTEITDQWNRIESPDINLCTYGQLIYNKGAKNI